MMRMATILMAGAMMALAGCRDGPGDAVTPSEDRSVAPEGPPQSIIREEVRSPEVEARIEAPMEMTVAFGDAAGLSADAGAAIDAFLGRARIEGTMPITLFGHSDSIGSDEANERASRTRAQAVATYLVEKGVDPDRIAIVALGEHNPARPNLTLDGSDDEAGQRANRRVEIVIGTPAQIAERRAAASAERAEKEDDAGLEAKEEVAVPAASRATARSVRQD